MDTGQHLPAASADCVERIDELIDTILDEASDCVTRYMRVWRRKNQSIYEMAKLETDPETRSALNRQRGHIIPYLRNPYQSSEKGKIKVDPNAYRKKAYVYWVAYPDQIRSENMRSGGASDKPRIPDRYKVPSRGYSISTFTNPRQKKHMIARDWEIQLIWPIETHFRCIRQRLDDLYNARNLLIKFNRNIEGQENIINESFFKFKESASTES
jgi:hypothetical protein